jgi:hypothetical protein
LNDGQNEAVASERHRLDGAAAALATREHFAQRSKLDPQIGLFNDDTGPDPSHEFIGRNNRARALYKCNQDPEGAAAELDWPVCQK